MLKKLLATFILLYILAIEPKFINLFKKELVVITFQQEDSQVKKAQEKVDKFFSTNKYESVLQKGRIIKTPHGQDISTKDISTKDISTKEFLADPIEVTIIDPQIDISISEMFDIFSELLKTMTEKIFEHEQIELFFC